MALIQLRFLPQFLRYLMVMTLLGLFSMSSGRWLFAWLNADLYQGIGSAELWEAFRQGMKFDAVICSYMILLPLLGMVVTFIRGKDPRKWSRFCLWYFNILFIVILSLMAADYPYFAFYNSRLTKGILSWTDQPGLMFEAMFTTPLYQPYLIGAVVLILLFVVLHRRFFIKTLDMPASKYKWKGKLLFFLLPATLLFFGMRGETELSRMPLTTENAFISDKAVINQLVINPVYNFFDSFGAVDIDFMPKESALEHVTTYLQLEEVQSDCSPVARRVVPDSLSDERPNLVLILVESLSAATMSAMNAKEKITPHLDSLAAHGQLFNQFYAAGIHTHNGIYSSLYGIPGFMHNKPMVSSSGTAVTYSGLPVTLQALGYQNLFFCTGDKRFDNMGGFLPANGFDRVIDENDYPEDQIHNSWGVIDHTQFDRAIEEFDAINQSGRPFFGTVLTVASHDGYNAPIVEDFMPWSEAPSNRRYQYTDWAIGRFMRHASSKAWFDNTIFIILGDHGQNFFPVYELPLNYVHIPMLIYGHGVPVGVNDHMGTQVDLFATIMNFIPVTYTNNTMGINLMERSHPFVYFSSDDYIGCLSEELYYLRRNSGSESVYRYREQSLEDVANQFPNEVQAMKQYTFSMLQTTDWLLKEQVLGSCE